jgi:MFS family permease
MADANRARGVTALLGDPYGRRSRGLIYAIAATVLIACTINAIRFGHWHWWLFVWGVLIGVLSATIYGLTLRLVPTILHASVERMARAQPRLAQMKRVLYPLMLSIGVALGVLASGMARAWPDVLLTLVVIVFQLMVPMAMLPRLRRRARALNM